MDIMLERILSLVPKKGNGKFQHGALKEFAQSIGLKNGNLVSDWIAGRSRSYQQKLYEIAAVYHVSVEWLKGETNEKKPSVLKNGELSAVQIEAIALVRTLSDEQLRKLIQMAKIAFDEGGQNVR